MLIPIALNWLYLLYFIEYLLYSTGYGYLVNKSTGYSAVSVCWKEALLIFVCLRSYPLLLSMNRVPYFRVRFADGYIFRMPARDVEDLRQRAAAHYWWGDEKPQVDQVTLTLQRHRRKAGLIHYDARAPGFPKVLQGVDSI